MSQSEKLTKILFIYFFSNTMRLASHGIRLGNGLKFHEVLHPAGRYRMYNNHFSNYYTCKMITTHQTITYMSLTIS